MVVMWVVLAAAALPTGGFALGVAAGLPAHRGQHGSSAVRVRHPSDHRGGPATLAAAAGLVAVGVALTVLGIVTWPPPPGLTHLTIGTATARAALVGLGALIGWVTTRP